MLLIASMGTACNVLSDWGTAPNSAPEAHVELTAVNVSPTVVHAGNQFTASATAAFSHCPGLWIINVTYGNQAYTGSENQSSVTTTFNAVLGQTAVNFEAHCLTAFAPIQTVAIQVPQPLSSFVRLANT